MMRAMIVALGAFLCITPLRAEDTLRFGTVAIDPGDEAALPVWVRNAQTVHGLSLAFAYDGRYLQVLRFAVNEQYVPASAVAYAHIVDVPAENHAVLGILFMWDAPSASSGFAPTPDGEERCIGWIVFGSTKAIQPAAYTILPRNNIGDPPISNTFCVDGGYSVLPALTAGTLDVRNHNILRLRSTYARPGEAARMVLEVDHAQPLSGLQMALSFENTVLRLRDDVPDSEDACVRSINYCGLPIETLLAPQRVEQFVLHVENEIDPGRGWASCGMVFDYVFPYQDHILPAGAAQGILAAHFVVGQNAQAGAIIPVMLTDGLGDPPVENKVLVALQDSDGHVLDVVSIAPLLEHGAVVVVGDEAPFRRGYVNEDDRRNIGDAINLLGFLFASGKEPGCLKAADANDDGRINIADGIRLLALLFVPGGEPLPAPSIECGVDPTPDALTCELRTYGCGT